MRRVTAVVLVGLVATVASLFGLLVVYSIGAQCHYGQEQWDALHKVIEAGTEPPTSIPPALEPFVNDEAIAAQRARLFQAQGSRPQC